jgi:hypothetical protein
MPNPPPNRRNLLRQHIQILLYLVCILTHALPHLGRYVQLVKLRRKININDLQRRKQKVLRLNDSRTPSPRLNFGNRPRQTKQSIKFHYCRFPISPFTFIIVFTLRTQIKLLYDIP